jgi:predicted N-formylglutamate amidohydrolase
MKCIISCEHASNLVPAGFSAVFAGKEKLLASHQAYDEGAARLARMLAKQLHAPVHLGSISRLLIDLNRSQTNRKSLYSSYSRKLPPGARELLLHKYYQPYRKKVEEDIAGVISRNKPVLHISLHSFAPVKGGKVRRADIGLLYDPARRNEKQISSCLARMLLEQAESLRVRRNYPYLGKTDGFTSFLRRKYSAKRYAGIEIEINQAVFTPGNKKYRQMSRALAEGLLQILKHSDFYGITKI